MDRAGTSDRGCLDLWLGLESAQELDHSVVDRAVSSEGGARKGLGEALTGRVASKVWGSTCCA